MNEHVRAAFQHLARRLEERKKVPITIVLKDGRRLEATFDPAFRSIELPNATFPDCEIVTWVTLFYGSEPTAVLSRTE